MLDINSTFDTSRRAPSTDRSDSRAEGRTLKSALRFENIPPIFILDTYFNDIERANLEESLLEWGAPLTYDITEARLFVGKIGQPRRARMELRSRKLETEPVIPGICYNPGSLDLVPRKRARSSLRGSDPVSEVEGEEKSGDSVGQEDLPKDMIHVVKISWLEDSALKGALMPFRNYTIYTAKAVPASSTKDSTSHRHSLPRQDSIISRAANDRGGTLTQPAWKSSAQRHVRTISSQTAHALLHQTTTEHDLNLTSALPTPPDWVINKFKYSCQRSTPINPPNASFIALLKTIREARQLTADEIGVRAYSTAIASLAAYPQTLTSPREILALPGCSAKIAALFAEWRNEGAHSRALAAVREIEDDSKIHTLRLFHEIWGVGPSTAREFYDKGWRDLDDVVEFGWENLSRVQQLGVKFYDEFAMKIARAEVESIESTVAAHAKQAVSSTGFNSEHVRTCIVGGYRRGKAESGDADIIVSHLETSATQDLIGPLVAALSESGWITHKLITHSGGSKHGQAPKGFFPGSKNRNIFDALDKALVVWQDPHFDEASHTRNPNPHRRVDIIIAPWPRVGCAVLGWSAGTTFERDLRRYAEKIKGWRFDSSGIRDRTTGQVVEAEMEGGKCTTIQEAEQKVFSALGLQYREPWERCTG